MTADLPCQNSSCKSFGQSHPNCRCYSSLATGGHVKIFCSKDQKHDPGCEYFADGGDVTAPSVDPQHAVSGYLAAQGLHGLLNMYKSPYLEAYHGHIKTGHKAIDAWIESLFDKEAPQQKGQEKGEKTIKDWISQGGITNDIQHEIGNQNQPQMLADGGAVEKAHGLLHSHPIATTSPEQNVILHAAKGRMSNYLSSLKPQSNQPKLAFDDEPDQTEQHKSYKRAVSLAANPLSILHKVKEGTIEPEHVKHLNGLHPEVNETIQKKLTHKITEAQLNGKKPSFQVRQGLSLLMGTPLSSEMSPQIIQAAQSTFMPPEPPPGSGAQPANQTQRSTKNKSGTRALTKSDQAFLTGGQALEKRAQKQ